MTTAKKPAQEGLLYSVLAKNAYNTKTPFIKSTGLRLAAMQYSEREKLDNIAETYLVNSWLNRNDPESELSISSYLTDDGMKMVSLTGKEDLSAYTCIDLGNSAPLDIALGDAIVRRRSIRDFTGDPLELNQLATLLRAAAGVSASAEIKLASGDEIEFNLRTVPSGGGLQPVDLYIVPLNIKALSPGIYRYQPVEDKLVVMGDGAQMMLLLKSFAGAINMVSSSNASLLVLYVAKPWRSMRKYGHRGLRFVFQEVGGMSQNLHLAVTALGLGSVDCASFFERDAHRALEIDGIYQTLLHSILVGIIA